MTFRVSDGLFTVPSVGQSVSEVAHVPLDVLLLLQPFDVEIWNSHGKSVVKTKSTKGQGHTETRHTGYIFRNCNTIWIDLVKHLISEHEVNDTFLVNTRSEVLVVAARESPYQRQSLSV